MNINGRETTAENKILETQMFHSNVSYHSTQDNKEPQHKQSKIRGAQGRRGVEYGALVMSHALQAEEVARQVKGVSKRAEGEMEATKQKKSRMCKHHQEHEQHNLTKEWRKVRSCHAPMNRPCPTFDFQQT